MFQVRGDIFRFINRPGEGYSSSRSDTNFPGTHSSYAIAQPLTDGNKGWSSFRTKYAWIGMHLRSKYQIVEMRWTQQDVHRAKLVNVNGQNIQLKDTDETVAYRFKTPIKAQYIRVRVLSTYDKKGIPVRHYWYMNDDFQYNKRETPLNNFVMASKNNALTYGLEQKNMSTFYKSGDRIIWRFRHSLWFTGSHQDLSATRTKKQFPVLGGTRIFTNMFQTGVNGKASFNKCPNYFVMISPNADVKFTFGSSKNVIKFVFNCATKYIYMPESKDNVAKEMNVAKRSSVNWDIYVDENGVRFNDNVGGGSMKKQSKLLSTWKKIYVFYGASQDIPTYKSHFRNIRIYSRGTGAQSIEFVGTELGNKAIANFNSITAKLSGTKSTSPTRLNGLELGKAVNNGDLRNSVAYSSEAPGIYNVAGAKVVVKSLKWKKVKNKKKGQSLLELGAIPSSDFDDFKNNVEGSKCGDAESLFKNVVLDKNNKFLFSCLDNKALCNCISKIGGSSGVATFSSSKYTLKISGNGDSASYEIVNKKRRRRLFQRGSGGAC